MSACESYTRHTSTQAIASGMGMRAGGPSSIIFQRRPAIEMQGNTSTDSLKQNEFEQIFVGETGCRRAAASNDP